MSADVPPEALQIRVHGDAHLPTLIYLPGLHGDWTLVGEFRAQLAARVRFVEFIHPRTIAWTLDDYAANIEKILAQNNITSGWLLGESYGSQIVWQILSRRQFPAQGIVLAGGFVKHPMRWGVRLVQYSFARIPYPVLQALLRVYGRLARLRYRQAPHIIADLDEFIARRTEPDRAAALHRLQHIADFDPRGIARVTALPVFYLSGAIDPIVPWFPVRRWLRRHCPAMRGDRILFAADHNVLGTAPISAARQILAWMRG